MALRISGSGGKKLVLTIEREDEQLDIEITPQLESSKNHFGETVDRYIIGSGMVGIFPTKTLA